ncbi:hypothetical protein [Psychroserpens sp. NJDZ02]|nr:hypothetical protein [Psychroserpens sp. NJDZ02]
MEVEDVGDNNAPEETDLGLDVWNYLTIINADAFCYAKYYDLVVTH